MNRQITDWVKLIVYQSYTKLCIQNILNTYTTESELRHYTKMVMNVASKFTKRCSAKLVMKKMQIKSTARCYYKLTIQKQKQAIDKYCQECGGT